MKPVSRTHRDVAEAVAAGGHGGQTCLEDAALDRKEPLRPKPMKLDVLPRRHVQRIVGRVQVCQRGQRLKLPRLDPPLRELDPLHVPRPPPLHVDPQKSRLPGVFGEGFAGEARLKRNAHNGTPKGRARNDFPISEGDSPIFAARNSGLSPSCLFGRSQVGLRGTRLDWVVDQRARVDAAFAAALARADPSPGPLVGAGGDL